MKAQKAIGYSGLIAILFAVLTLGCTNAGEETPTGPESLFADEPSAMAQLEELELTASEEAQLETAALAQVNQERAARGIELAASCSIVISGKGNALYIPEENSLGWLALGGRGSLSLPWRGQGDLVMVYIPVKPSTQLLSTRRYKILWGGGPCT